MTQSRKMTINEAIAHLNELTELSDYEMGTLTAKDVEALKMAIESLKREALVEKMTKAYYKELKKEADR